MKMSEWYLSRWLSFWETLRNWICSTSIRKTSATDLGHTLQKSKADNLTSSIFEELQNIKKHFQRLLVIFQVLFDHFSERESTHTTNKLSERHQTQYNTSNSHICCWKMFPRCINLSATRKATFLAKSGWNWSSNKKKKCWFLERFLRSLFLLIHLQWFSDSESAQSSVHQCVSCQNWNTDDWTRSSGIK